MSRKSENTKWEEYINKFNSYRGEITLKDFCIENQLSKTQFYYHKKRLEKANSKATVFHKVSLKADKDNRGPFSDASKEIKISIGNTIISIPASETALVYSVIKDLVTKC